MAKPRSERHNFALNAKVFAERQVDEIIEESLPGSYQVFCCIGEAGDYGALLEKWNQWIQGYARYAKWTGLTTVETDGNKLQLAWGTEPQFVKRDDGALTLAAEVAINGE